MCQNDFYDYSVLFNTTLKIKNVKNNYGETLKWRKTKWLQYIKTDLGNLQYKETLDISKPFQSIRLLRQGQARASFIPPLSYTKALPITEAKKRDLLSLLQFIPVIFHDYYKNLSTDTTNMYLSQQR